MMRTDADGCFDDAIVGDIAPFRDGTVLVGDDLDMRVQACVGATA